MSVILAKVLQEYSPNNEGELALRKGQVIVIKDQGANGWWRGLYKKDDGTFAKGKFPSSCVSILDEEELKRRKIKVVKSSSGGDIPSSEGSKGHTSASPRASSAPRTSSESNIPASTTTTSPSSSSSSSSSKKKSSSSHHAKLFGVPLSLLVDASRPVPAIISHSIHYLTVNGLNVPNLFRGTADKKKIQELKEAFEKSLTTGKLPDLSNWELSVITSTFKLFLFYLPGHLLAVDNGYNDLTQAARLDDQSEIVAKITKVIDNFPDENKRLIKVLFNFLYPNSTLF